MPSLTNSPGTAPAPASPAGLPTADHVVAHTLLNCLLREVSGPGAPDRRRHRPSADRLPRRGVLLRVALRRTSLLGAHRFTGPVTEQAEDGWAEVGWRPAGRVRARGAVAAHRRGQRRVPRADRLQPSGRRGRARLARRTAAGRAPDREDEDWLAAYLASEQSLLFGHRFHPTPKARTGDPASWQSYAPEAGASFPLLLLAVRDELIAEEAAEAGATAALDALHTDVPDGYRLLPVHPWQYELLRDHPGLREALDRDDIRVLGTGDDAVRGDRVRAHALRRRVLPEVQPERPDHQLPAQERQLRAVRRRRTDPAAGAGPHRPRRPLPRQRGAPRARLPQPRAAGHRTAGRRPSCSKGSVSSSARACPGGCCPAPPRCWPAAVADEYPTSPAHVSRLLDGAGPQAALDWWAAYLNLLLPPVLAAYFDHGLVLEPHLQNVLVCVDGDGMPAQVLFRDLEGTKLVPEHHTDLLAVAARVDRRADDVRRAARLGPRRVLPAGQPRRRDARRARRSAPGHRGRAVGAGAPHPPGARRPPRLPAAAGRPAGRGAAARQGQSADPLGAQGRPRGRLRPAALAARRGRPVRRRARPTTPPPGAHDDPPHARGPRPSRPRLRARGTARLPLRPDGAARARGRGAGRAARAGGAVLRGQGQPGAGDPGRAAPVRRRLRGLLGRRTGARRQGRARCAAGLRRPRQDARGGRRRRWSSACSASMWRASTSCTCSRTSPPASPRTAGSRCWPASTCPSTTARWTAVPSPWAAAPPPSAWTRRRPTRSSHCSPTAPTRSSNCAASTPTWPAAWRLPSSSPSPAPS